MPRTAAALALVLLAACQSGGPSPSSAPQPAVDPATIAARQALANEASLDVRAIPERAIAVPALSVNAADTSLAPLGYGLADMMITDLSRSAQVQLVEREKLNALLRELKMVDAGQVDTTQAPRVGRLVGARRLIVGNITDLPNGQFVVDTRLVNTVDGTINGGITARAPLASIFDAEKALVYRVFQEMGVTLTPAERAAIEQRPTANPTALIAYSRGVRDEAHGQYEAAAADYRAAVRADPGFTPAQQHLNNVTVAAQTIAQTPATTGDKSDTKSDTKTTTTATTTTAPSAPTSVGTAAAAAVAGAVNPSPASTLGTTSNASSTQQQQQSQDHGSQAVHQPVFATVVIKVTQLP